MSTSLDLCVSLTLYLLDTSASITCYVHCVLQYKGVHCLEVKYNMLFSMLHWIIFVLDVLETIHIYENHL